MKTTMSGPYQIVKFEAAIQKSTVYDNPLEFVVDNFVLLYSPMCQNASIWLPFATDFDLQTLSEAYGVERDRRITQRVTRRLLP